MDKFYAILLSMISVMGLYVLCNISPFFEVLIGVLLGVALGTIISLIPFAILVFVVVRIVSHNLDK